MRAAVIIMVAPNGARKTKQDHPALPLSIEETVDEAAHCFDHGASILHAHVRDQHGQHTLDAGLYRELLAALHARCPDLLVQVTTEAVGRYTPQQQAACVKAVQPRMLSVAVREMAATPDDWPHAKDFYHWCAAAKCHVQHILYDRADLHTLMQLQARDVIPRGHCCALFVLGRYPTAHTPAASSGLAELDAFTTAPQPPELDWFVCAFGHQERDCITAAVAAGGHARVGFENNLHLANGDLAASSAAQVADLRTHLTQAGYTIATPAQTRATLWRAQHEVRS